MLGSDVEDSDCAVVDTYDESEGQSVNSTETDEDSDIKALLDHGKGEAESKIVLSTGGKIVNGLKIL